MKKPGFKLLFGIFFGIELCLAQSYINLSVDNDLFFMKDRYYSSGIFISTGKLNKNQDKSMIIVSHNKSILDNLSALKYEIKNRGLVKI